MQQNASGITATRVPKPQRLDAADRHFGIRFPMIFEPMVYRFTEQLAKAYTGGYWHFYALSNGASTWHRTWRIPSPYLPITATPARSQRMPWVSQLASTPTANCLLARMPLENLAQSSTTYSTPLPWHILKRKPFALPLTDPKPDTSDVHRPTHCGVSWH